MAAVTYDELSSSFNDEEIKDLMARSADLGLKDGASRSTFLRHRLTMKQQEQASAAAELRGSPDFQTRVVEQQLPEGAQADLTGEAFNANQAFQAKASPLVGGYGGAATTEGELADVRQMFPGKDVRPVRMPTATGDQTLYMVEGEDGQYTPTNAPGFSRADWNGMIGDMATLEGVGSLVPFLGPLKRAKILARASAGGLGAGAGAAADAVLDEKAETQFGHVMARAGSGAVLGFLGEGLADVAGSAVNFAAGRGSARDASDLTFQRAQKIQDLGAPLHAGQVSPASFTAIMRRRWAQYTPVLREQVVQQNLWAGRKASEAMDEFLKMDGVEQALVAGGLDPRVLEEMEREYGATLVERTTRSMGARGNQSRSGAGRDVQEALFDVTNKEKASYRALGNARLNDLEDKLLNAADDAGQFTIGLQLPIRSAKEELARFPVLQNQPTRTATDVDSGREVLGAGIREIQTKHHEDLAFVLKTLAELPEDFVHSRATYQVRNARAGSLVEEPLHVDGNGDLRVPYTEKGRGGLPAKPGESGPQQPSGIIGTYAFDGVETIRMLRGKLRDFFGNPLIPAGSYDARVAKKLYGELGQALEQADAAPAFQAAVKRYNRSAETFLGNLDRLQTAKFAGEQDAQGLLTQFTSGAMGFETALKLKGVLTRVPDYPEAWSNFKNASTRDLIQNPDKIKNLDIEPKTAMLMYSPEELTALRTYGKDMETLASNGFAPIARRASGVRERAVALFSTMPNERSFTGMWSRLSDTDKNVMRYAILEDIVNRSTRTQGGAVGVLSPAAFTQNIGKLLQGDRGVRMRLMFDEKQIKGMEDLQEITAFYKEVQGDLDMGAGISASETAGSVQNQLLKGDDRVQGALTAALIVRANKMFATSLADGLLSRLMAPRLREPWNLVKAQAFATLAATTVNNDVHAAETDFDKVLRDEAEQAKRRSIIPAREK